MPLPDPTPLCPYITKQYDAKQTLCSVPTHPPYCLYADAAHYRAVHFRYVALMRNAVPLRLPAIVVELGVAAYLHAVFVKLLPTEPNCAAVAPLARAVEGTVVHPLPDVSN